MAYLWDKVGIWSLNVPYSHTLIESDHKQAKTVAQLLSKVPNDHNAYILIEMRGLAALPQGKEIHLIGRIALIKELINNYKKYTKLIKAIEPFVNPSFILLLGGEYYPINKRIMAPELDLAILIKLCVRDLLNTDNREIYDLMKGEFIKFLNRLYVGARDYPLFYMAYVTGFTDIERVLLIECMPQCLIERIASIKEQHYDWCLYCPPQMAR
jgi:hypothetical protein